MSVVFKTCISCNASKPVDEFKLTHKGGHKPRCELCMVEYRKEYYNKNKERIKARQKKYRADNIEDINKKARDYSAINRVAKRSYASNYRRLNREKINKYNRSRRLSDSGYNILGLLRGRLSKAVGSHRKSAKTIELLGCSLKQLLIHLQSTAKDNYPGVDFDINNYSGTEWHIDHVKPCAAFDLTKESEQRECFNWGNLQILSAEDNMNKSSSLELV